MIALLIINVSLKNNAVNYYFLYIMITIIIISDNLCY